MLSSGIGKSIVKKLAEEGAKVMIADYNKSLGEVTAKEFQAEGLTVDFCVPFKNSASDLL